MRSELTIFEPPWSVILIRRRDASPAELPFALPPAGMHVDRWFPETPGCGFRSRTQLLRVCELLGEPRSAGESSTARLRALIRRAFEENRLLAIPVEPLGLAARAVPAEPAQPRAPKPPPREPESRLTLHVSRLYHDNVPVERAHFRVGLDGGDTVEGQLDTNGTAVVPGLRATPRRVRFGPDERTYRLVDDTPNPAYDEALDADALVARRLGEAGETNGEHR